MFLFGPALCVYVTAAATAARSALLASTQVTLALRLGTQREIPFCLLAKTGFTVTVSLSGQGVALCACYCDFTMVS